MKLVLDSGGVSWFAERSPRTTAVIRQLRSAGLWPPLVPAPVLIECLTGVAGRDAETNRLLPTCDVQSQLSEAAARRCAALRHQARRGSAVDAIVVGLAEPSGVVITGDMHDLRALAERATRVQVRPV